MPFAFPEDWFQSLYKLKIFHDNLIRTACKHGKFYMNQCIKKLRNWIYQNVCCKHYVNIYYFVFQLIFTSPFQ